MDLFGNDVYRAYERNLSYTNKFARVLDRWTGEELAIQDLDIRLLTEITTLELLIDMLKMEVL